MKQKKLWMALAFLAAFGLWTLAVKWVDVQPIGPLGSSVGFATPNGFIHRMTGVHWALYDLTDRLSLIPLGFIAGFGVLGLVQWVRRRKLRRVDRSILVLGGFYLAVLAAFVLFEVFPVNFRPVLIDGVLEASYPSSTTMLAMCVMPTAAMELRRRVRNKALTFMIAAFTVFMVVGRLLSGVHWFTDIVGGGLLSIGLVRMYDFFNS